MATTTATTTPATKTLSLCETLATALRDWRANRAFIRGNAFYVRPIEVVCGVKTVGRGVAKKAPWSDAALAWFGGSERLHVAAHVAYPAEEPESDFARMHGFDSVRSRLVAEMAVQS